MNMRQLQPGSPVFFGRYPQGAEGEVQPIEWQVLEVRENRALLLSRYVLDMQPFHSETGCVRWIDTTVCQWLRETFLPTAFSREEQAEIHHPDPKADPNEDFLTWLLLGGEERIDDPVFLLSTEEVGQYFPNDIGHYHTGSAARMTPWVGATYPDVSQVNGNVCWWLRSSSSQYPYASIVSPVDTLGASLVDPDNRQGVRPAIWVMTDAGR